MKKINQLHTEMFRGSFSTSYRLIFIAEGYVDSQENLFYKDVFEILKKLENTFPFNLLKGNMNNAMFSSYLSFTPSNSSGYATSASSAVGRTVFESYVTGNQLYLNHSKINDYIDELVFEADNDEPFDVNNGVNMGLEEITDGIQINSTNTLIFILLPQDNRADIELEVIDTNTYYSVATSVDFFSEQIVLRAVAKMFGLGDEFDLPGTNFLQPTELQGEGILHVHHNLLYAENINVGPNPSIDELLPWRSFFDKDYNYPIPIHKNTNPGTINRSLPSKIVSYKEIELWEGGGGFRTDVYRSAEDCLMRRRIGDISLPIKNQKVSFCPVCRELLSVLFSMK